MATVRWRLIALAVGLAAATQGAHAGCSRSIMPDGMGRFVVTGAEVRDRASGLVWQRCSLGADINGDCKGERALVSYAQAKAASASAGRGWRLPTFLELVELLDQDCGQPATDTRVFPDVSAAGNEGSEEYWTSTPGGINDMMSTIDFSYGYREIRSPGFPRRARLVRSGS